MPMAIQSDPVPLWTDEHGDARVAGTRILFDVLIDLHQQGRSAEYIAAGYPSLTLADVYGVLAYYYRHKEEADQYLRLREDDARALRQEIEARQEPLPPDLRAGLEALAARRDAAGVAPTV